MSKKIVLIDYGAGNLKSVQKAFQALGQHPEITTDRHKIQAADLLILPGQGAFASAMANLTKLELVAPITAHLRQGKPYLGICLGLQLLFESSLENGLHQGLGIFPGQNISFLDTPNFTHKVPHIGWNNLSIDHDPHGLFRNLPASPFVYFVHSYFVTTTAPNLVAATSNYGLNFTAAIQAPNLLATQFHPEKSGTLGLAILTNFLNYLKLT